MVAVTWIRCVLRLLCRNRPEGVVFKARIPNSRDMVVLREVIGADIGKQLCKDAVGRPATICSYEEQHAERTMKWKGCGSIRRDII